MRKRIAVTGASNNLIRSLKARDLSLGIGYGRADQLVLERSPA
jgi:hypothetical protein